MENNIGYRWTDYGNFPIIRFQKIFEIFKTNIAVVK